MARRGAGHGWGAGAARPRREGPPRLSQSPRTPLPSPPARPARPPSRSGKALLDDFADDVADLVGGADGGASAIDAVFQRHKASQRFGADLEAQAAAAGRRGARSGDADLPAREALHERRAKLDSVRARQQVRGGGVVAGGWSAVRGECNLHPQPPLSTPPPAHPPACPPIHPSISQMTLGEDEGPEELGGRGGGAGGRARREREEDEFYAEAKAAVAAKKARRADVYAFPETAPPAEDPSAAGARGISRDIEKNRGLTPHRRKDIKNPRKKHRCVVGVYGWWCMRCGGGGGGVLAECDPFCRLPRSTHLCPPIPPQSPPLPVG